jgi:hypothetical protein
MLMARDLPRSGGFMRVDNYTRAVLTVIALCLIYLCARETAPPALAQAGATRVVITGVDFERGGTPGVLPVGVVGEMRMAGQTFTALPIQPVRMRAAEPLEIYAPRPIKVEAEEPLLVRAVKDPGSQRPGH